MFIHSAATVLIYLTAIATVQNSAVLAAEILRPKLLGTAEGNRIWLKAYGFPTAAQIKEEEEMQPTLNSWNAGQVAFARLDERKKFAIKKLGSNNVLKIAKAEARKNKAEFQNDFAMGFISECYDLGLRKVEEVAKKNEIKKRIY
jgi:hypothetical protein